MLLLTLTNYIVASQESSYVNVAPLSSGCVVTACLHAYNCRKMQHSKTKQMLLQRLVRLDDFSTKHIETNNKIGYAVHAPDL